MSFIDLVTDPVYQDGADGVDVCLSCFNGGCLDSTRHHALTHHQLTGHPLAVNIRRITVNQPKRVKFDLFFCIRVVDLIEFTI